ncbi:carbohydrate ABC transporter substrate-binding protein (CUT1 family) [Mobilisporobacter senegalensis]|uniref:Carbohydrate ABC transporter substrate-binding protein (CUT1 family) n=1 Tax=Mobilisporobacter senegalensis TaxID=1329262 RepID=A0A3N1XUW7_9FIRM|nr:extracellular solute-binding protein [Mobilisporobacter senegalensis]ROR30425.1 carbohydrate ABC transporter substrate-binding protein (CUT1 family) [Mobilisporobacter senegalensis]
MNRRKSYFFYIILIISIVWLTGCQKTADKTEESKRVEEPAETANEPGWKKNALNKVTLDWYINFSWYTTTWGENLISKAITEETGVDINFIVPTGNEMEKLNSMIASDTLPDLITLGWWDMQAQELPKKNLVYALNKLADEYDPYFYKVADGQIIDWYKNGDGNFYCYPSSSFSPDDYKNNKKIGSNQNFLVRKDIYEAIGSPDMTTPEGFIAACEKAVAYFPEVDNKPLIPIGSDEFTIHGCNSFDKYLHNFLSIPYEMNGEYYDRYTDPEYIRWLKTFRKLNEMGYIHDEIFIDKRMQLEEKMAEGRYFCLLYQGSDIQTPQKTLYAKDPDKIYIAVDGPKNSKGEDPTLPSAGLNGWTVTFISKNCKYPDRAIEFLSYFISERGQKMTYLGIEGVTYDDVDGKPVMKPKIKALLNTDRKKFDEIYGADNAFWMLQDNVMQSKWGTNEGEPMAQLKEWTYPYAAYTAQYDVIFENGTDISNAYSQIQQEWGKTLPRLLLADSEKEFDIILEKFKKKRIDLGYDKILEESTKQMNETKKKLGME